MLLQRGNATYNPGYWDTALGLEERRQHEQAANEVALRNLRGDITREASVVQRGAHVFTPEEFGQRQEIAQASLDALEATAPLVGMIGGDAVRKAMGHVAVDTMTEQRNLRKASRELDRITKLNHDGTHSMTQTTGAIEKLREQYGDGLLTRLPQYAQMVGLENQLAEARDKSMSQFAKANGWDRKYVSWDAKADAPTVNTEAIYADTAITSIEQRKSSMANKATKELIEAINVKTQSLDKQMATVSRAIANREAQGLDVSALYRQHYNLAGQQMRNQRQIDAALGMLSPPAPTRQPTAAVNAPTQRAYGSRAEAAAAVRDGQIRSGDKVLIDGVPSMFNGAQFRKVL